MVKMHIQLLKTVTYLGTLVMVSVLSFVKVLWFLKEVRVEVSYWLDKDQLSLTQTRRS